MRELRTDFGAGLDRPPGRWIAGGERAPPEPALPPRDSRPPETPGPPPGWRPFLGSNQGRSRGITRRVRNSDILRFGPDPARKRAREQNRRR